MPRKYTIRSKEEKLSIVKQVLNGMPVCSWESQGIHHGQVQDWTKAYLEHGESGLEPKKKPGNPLSRYERRKELTYEEQLQYQIELLKRELITHLKNTVSSRVCQEPEIPVTMLLWKVSGVGSRIHYENTFATGRARI